MAMNAAEAKEMVERARAANVLAVIDHELRFLKSRKTMRMMLVSGAIGTVRHCNYVFDRIMWRARSTLDWWSDENMGGAPLGLSARMLSIRSASCSERKLLGLVHAQ